MADTTTGQKIILSVFFAGLGVVVWIMLPLFLPVYLWMEVDFKQLAEQHKNLEGATLEELQKEWTWKVYYNPRGEGDPLPWQIMSDNENYPAWITDDEYNTLVRVNFISAAEGTKPSSFFLANANDYDRFYTATGFRLPPGSLGIDNKRSIFLFTAREKENFGMSKAHIDHIRTSTGDNLWLNDDDWEEWPERDDGYRPPEPPDPDELLDEEGAQTSTE